MDPSDLAKIHRDGSLTERRTTADWIADDVREAIHSGRIQDGAVLKQSEIATRFGVSRVPVREAMRQLQAEGFIDASAHQLAVVRALPVERIAEIYDNRAVLEGHMTYRAVPNLGREAVEELRARESKMRSVNEHVRWLRLNGEFHARILRAANDVTALELVRQLQSRAERYVRLWSGGEGVHSAREAGEEHAAIIDCIEAGDADGARVAVERHIRHTSRRLVAYGRTLRP